MPDPFATESEWQDCRSPRLPSERMLNTVSRYYNQGNFHRVTVLLDIVLSRRPDAPPPPAWAWAYKAWVESRSGHVERALGALQHFESRFEHRVDGELDPRDAADQIVNRVAVLRFQGLCPDAARLAPWLERGERADIARWRRETLVSFLGHKGYALSREGRIDAAIAVLRRALEIPLDRTNHLRIAARVRCDLADCLRLVGERAEARRQLESAERTFVEHGFRGDHADHWAPASVKLDPASDRATDILRRAFAVQRRIGHPVGGVRTLLLRARITKFRAVATRSRRQVEREAETMPDLGRCPLLRTILDRWDEWAMRYPEPAVGGDPFWLL